MVSDIDWQDVAVGLGLALLVSLVIAQLSAWLVRALVSAATGSGSETSFRDPIRRRPIRIVRALVFLGTLVVVTPPILEFLGVDLSYGIPLERASAWIFEEGLRVALITLLAYFAVRITALGVEHFEEGVRQRTSGDSDKVEFAQRLRTIGGLIKNAVNVVVMSAAVLMILQELGMDITPLLAGAGVASLAVGFGAQNLVRDVISGFFLILEDQVHVGDVVNIDGTSGLVESVHLRTIVLRDLSGTVHIIPNGAISTLSNLTKEFSYAVLDVGIAYKEDTDHVSDVLRDIGEDLSGDPAFAPHLLAPLEILGVNEFGDSAVVIKIRIKTRPLKQWMVARELRRRIKKVFDAQGIEIPFPHVSLYFGEASRPFLTQPIAADLVRAVPTSTLEPDRRPRRQGSTVNADDDDAGDFG